MKDLGDALLLFTVISALIVLGVRCTDVDPEAEAKARAIFETCRKKCAPFPHMLASTLSKCLCDLKWER